MTVTRPPLAAEEPCPAPRVLVALLRCAPPREDPAPLRRLLEGVDDWDGLLSAAYTHRLLELLAFRAREVGARLPPEPADMLERTRGDAVRLGLATAHAAARVHAALSDGGVDAATFKGQAVAAQAYGDPLTRTSVDLDLLVRERDRPRAVEVLTRAGYRAEHALPARVAAVVMRGECELVLFHPRSLTVELHWKVLPSSYGTPIPAGSLLDRSQPLDVLGWSLPSLCLEDAVVVAAVHGYKHFWQLLEHAATVAGLLRSPALDADRLLSRARELGACRRTLVGAGVAAAVLHAALPQSMHRALQSDDEARRVTALAVDRLWGTIDGRVRMRQVARSTGLDVRALDRPADLARCLAAKLGLPRFEDAEWLSLPGSAAWLYYGVRPCRLGVAAVEGLARRVRATPRRRGA